MQLPAARRIAAVAATALAVVLPASAAAASPAPCHHHHHARQLAEIELTQFKVVLKAIRGPANGGAPLATVRAYVYKPVSHGWRLVTRITVGKRNGWFWFPVSVCTVSATPGHWEPNSLTVSLLITPSIGCSEPKTVRW